MTNRVPPLHPASPPPLHPASPPPFSKCHFPEDDVDENEDFSNYTTANSELNRKFSRDLSEVVEVSAVDDVKSVSCTINTMRINDETVCDSKEDLYTSDNTENNWDDKSTPDRRLSGDYMTQSCGVHMYGSQMITNHSTSTTLHSSASSSLSNNTVRIESSSEDNSPLNNPLNSSSVIETKELVPPEAFESGLIVEYNDDSSLVIAENAVSVENESEIEEKNNLDDDGFRGFSNCKFDAVKENLYPELNTFPLEMTDKCGTNITFGEKLLSSTTEEQAMDATARTFNSSLETCWPNPTTATIDCVPSFQSHSMSPDKSVDAVSENDDFDDFVSPPINEQQSTDQISHDTDRNFVDVEKEKTSNTEKLDSVIAGECWSDIFKYNGEDPIEVNLNTLEGKLNGSSIWYKIKSIETSLALNYNWNDSETKKLLLATLGVDSRNILFGPRWNSEVPRFASNLGFSPLIPQKASAGDNSDYQHSCPIVEEPPIDQTNSCESGSRSSTDIRDAHFDWTNSGLINPLDAHSNSTLLDLDLLANFDIHSPRYKEKRKSDRITKVSTTVSQLENPPTTTDENSTPNRGLSEEAIRILKSMPDLLVMEKQYIVFPIR